MDSQYINRELSLLDFQDRVLRIAESPNTPILERAKFVAIVSSNLDEFFQVRVAGLRDQVSAGLTKPSPDGPWALDNKAYAMNRFRRSRNGEIFRPTRL